MSKSVEYTIMVRLHDDRRIELAVHDTAHFDMLSGAIQNVELTPVDRCTDDVDALRKHIEMIIFDVSRSIMWKWAGGQIEDDEQS